MHHLLTYNLTIEMKKNLILGHLRKITGLSVEQLSSITGLSKRIIYDVENDSQTINDRIILYYSSFFKVSPTIMRTLFDNYDKEIYRFFTSFQSLVLSIILTYLNIGEKLSSYDE